MPNEHDFDMDYRPPYYFGPLPSAIYHGATVKGAIRQRHTISLSQQEGGLIDEPWARSSLSNDDRQAQSSVHPALMGGEYLPDMFEGELEIARGVMWGSTLCDTISIRVRREEGRYTVQVVDEYPDDPDMPGKGPISPSIFDQPLTMREIVRVIDQCGMVSAPRQSSYECLGDTETYANWVSVSSVFYPELERWFQVDAEEWLAAHTDNSDEEDDDTVVDLSSFR